MIKRIYHYFQNLFKSEKADKNLDFRLSNKSFWGINILIILLLLYGFFVNTQYLEIKKYMKKSELYTELSYRTNNIKDILFRLKDSPEPLYEENILGLKAEIQLVKEIYFSLEIIKNERINNDFLHSIISTPNTIIKLFENDDNIDFYILKSANKEYKLLHINILSIINDNINSFRSEIKDKIEYLIFATIFFVCIYLLVFIIGYYSIFYPAIIDLELDFINSKKTKKNLQSKLNALKHLADRLNTEVPHKLTKDEIKTAVIENREDERYLLSSHLEHLQYLVNHSVHKSNSVDFSDLINLQKTMKDIQFDLKQLTRELERQKYKLLPSDIMSRGLIPSIVNFCKHNNKYSSLQFKYLNINKVQTSLHYIHEINLYRLIVDCAEMIIENHYYKVGLYTLSVDRNDWQLMFHFYIEDSYLNKDESKKAIKNITERYYHIIKRATLVDTSVTQYTSLSLITDVIIVYPLNKK